MKRRVLILLVSIFSSCTLLTAQNRDVNELMADVRTRFNQVKDYEASARIKIDVDFLKIPVKQGKIWFLHPDKVKVKAPGFSLLPKRGMNFSPGQLMDAGHTAIFVRDEMLAGNAVAVVKIVPGNAQSDILIATLWIDSKRKVVRKVEATTRNEGTFVMDFTFKATPDPYDMPTQARITFDIRKNELPLGLTGDFERAPEEKGKKNSGRGVVTIDYVDYTINMGKAAAVFNKK
ncbi:MAG: LolA family protein [Bacteroidota bacterium]